MEESVAEESPAEVGRLEAGVVVGQEIVREQIKNCVDKSGPMPFGMDICDCGNALLVACLAHTHKNGGQSDRTRWGKRRDVFFVVPPV